jgi:multimeric flavodoxin WrbA
MVSEHKTGKAVEKILVLLGSPRRQGNSALLAEQIVKGALSANAAIQAETVFLQEKRIAPCQSCYACQKKKSKGCAIQDDMQAIYPKMIEADAWVIASPVYWFSLSAQTKLWMDRCFALPAYQRNAFTGRRIAVAMSYGDKDPFASGCINALRTFQDAYSYTQSHLVGMVYGSAMDAGEIQSNTKVLQEAFALGEKLALAP